MAQQKPAISVVVPMYNVQEFVGECLQSLLDQTFTDFEAICVDDGSTDDTLNTARQTVGDDSRFQFITRENGGLSAARNTGIDHATGEYLVFMDSDDYYAPNALQRMYNTLTSQNLDYLDFTAHTFYDTERARQLRNEDYYESRPDVAGVMTGTQLFTTYQRQVEFHCAAWLRIFKRSLLDATDGGEEGTKKAKGLKGKKAKIAHGIHALRTHSAEPLRFQEGIIHEDELFSPLLYPRAQRAAFLNEPLYQRRMREGSIITATDGLPHMSSMLQVARGLDAWLRAHADECDPAFVDALAQRVREVRGLAVDYALAVEPGRLAEYAAQLTGDDLIDFDLTIVGGLSDGEQLDRALQAERLYYPRRAWHAARKVGKAAKNAATSVATLRDDTMSGGSATVPHDNALRDATMSGGSAVGAALVPPAEQGSTPVPTRIPFEPPASPRVSVIIAAYNAQDFIAQSIASLQAQTLQDFEIIVVDDGSTDDTPAIVQRLALGDPRIRLISQENAGPGVARNVGLDAAQGQYVYCLDADDFAHRTLLATCVQALDDTRADMAVFAFRSFNSVAGREFPAPWGMLHADKVPTFPNGTFTWRNAPDLFFDIVRSVPWNKMVRRSLLVENNIRFQEIYLTEDAMYSLPAAICARSIVRIAKPLMVYREYSGSNSMADRGRRPLDFLDAMKALRTWMQERGVYDDLRVAWQTWLLDAVHYNLPMFRSVDAFNQAYDVLTADNLRAFDLAELDPDDIMDRHQRMLFAALKTGDREQFLLTCANCAFEHLEDVTCEAQRVQTPGTVARTMFSEAMRTQETPVMNAARTLHGLIR